MKTEFGPAIIKFLKVMGYNSKKIEMMSYNTELVKDLNLHGDSLFEALEILSEKFEVDMSSMNYELYGHDEGYYLSPARLFDSFKKNKLTLLPITLRMIEKSIIAKKWVSN